MHLTTLCRCRTLFSCQLFQLSFACLPPTASSHTALAAVRTTGNIFVYRQHCCASIAEYGNLSHSLTAFIPLVLRTCHISATDRAATVLVPARPTVVCRGTPVLRKAPREPTTPRNQSKFTYLSLSLARLVFRSSRSQTNARRVTSLHAAIVEANVMLRCGAVACAQAC